MCGRFSLGLAADDIEQLHGYPHLASQVRGWVNREAFVPRYNVAPRSQAPVIRRRSPSPSTTANDKEGKDEGAGEEGEGEGELVLHTMKWGLVPHWSKKEDTTLSTINARAESLCEGGSQGVWGSVKGRRRCVVPAQGYYEWLKKGRERVPYFTRFKDEGKLVMFAGLYDVAYLDGHEEPLYTFTIITTSAPQSFSWLHDRQPVILDSESAISAWLASPSPSPSASSSTTITPSSTSQAKSDWTPALARLISHPLSNADAKLECYAVPKEVGKVGNEDASFVRPVRERRGGLEDMFSRQAKKGGVKEEALKKEEGLKAKREEGVGDVVAKGEKRKRDQGDVEGGAEAKPLKTPKKEEDTEVEIISPPSSQDKTRLPSGSQDRLTPKKPLRKAAKKEESGVKITSFFGKKT
ncbi:unnamed protein product [Peniophora sp. CBMAI 1063]|nr:unnamed protein product [Peniophora sp. CBMAI 1063]